MKTIVVFFIVLIPSLIASDQNLTYIDIIQSHCAPPFHYYKSWCYYIFPNLTLDWPSAYRLCHSIDKHTHLVYISGDDDMIDPLRDILINREKSKEIKSVWTNTTWGQQRRTILSRNAKRLCRKIELKSNLKTGQIDTLRMPFSNCREKHSVMCRKQLPLNLTCRRPWSLAYGICYYLDEQVRIVKTEEEERNILQCQAWNGQLFSSSKQEKTIIKPFLSYSLNSLRSSTVISENFGGISYTFQDLIQDNCSLISGDVYFSTSFNQLKNQNQTSNCSSYNSHTLCRQSQNTTCEPPWFYDDGFCLYFSSESSVDMGGASIECSQNNGYLLYINNEYELFRLTHNLISLAPFFKHRSLAGVWLGLTYKALRSADEDDKDDDDDNEDNFDWRWDLSIESYLDDQWKLSDWRKYFQYRLQPDIVSAGDCAALILDTKIREPIERTSCHNQRAVVCRKPLANEKKSFHKKANYDRFVRLQNFNENSENQRRPSNNTILTFNISRTIFEPLNTTTYRLIVYINGSTTVPIHLVFTCKSKGILIEESISTNDFSLIIKFDITNHVQQSEYDILFNYLQSSNCTNTTGHQCVHVSCADYDAWYYSLPEMQNRLEKIRNHTSTNQRCLLKHQNSNFHAQICSLLIDQFRISEEILSIQYPAFQTNECKDWGGQCVPDSLIGPLSMQFSDSSLNCPTGFICWFQGERCGVDAFCIDRIRYPCSQTSRLLNTTCSNSRHECCGSLTASNDSPLYISTESNSRTWNILLPIYYFSFHGTSKWDQFFFNSWLHLGSDISQDFINDEFLFSCTAVFIEPTLLLTHESCLPTRLSSNDKRSILFALIPKEENHEFDKVALHIQTYQIYSPFQLVRLSYQHDFLVNKTFQKLNSMKLTDRNINELYCVIAINEYDIRQIRLINNFERQFIFDDQIAVFSFINTDNENDDEWLFSPIACILNDKHKDWTIVGISGRQLKHKCKIINQTKYCQMVFIYSSSWTF